MKSIKSLLMVCICAILLFGCSSAPPLTNPPTDPPAVFPNPIQSPIFFKTFDLPNAKSVSIAGNTKGTLYLVHGEEGSLYVSRSIDAGQTFSEPVLVTGDIQAHVLPVERPAIAIDDENRVSVAWLELPPDFQGANIWQVFSEDGGRTFTDPVLAGMEPFGEVAMVQVALDGEGNPLLTWLNGSKLKFTRSFDGGGTFSEIVHVGGGSCECCQPQIIAADEHVFIAYRGLESGGTQGDIRDILMIRSADGGKIFSPVTRVSDAHWYLPACPIAGPSMAVSKGNLFISWMDGRFEPAGTFNRGDVWFAASTDGGESFSPNIRINPDQDSHHTLPAIAIGPGGRIHAAWEALSQSGGSNNLYYTFSDDGGQTFFSPQVFADNTDASLGNPGKAVLFIDPEGNVALAWLDRSGAHVASWIDPK